MPIIAQVPLKQKMCPTGSLEGGVVADHLLYNLPLVPQRGKATVPCELPAQGT